MQTATSTASPTGPMGDGVMDPHGLHRVLHPVWFRPVHAALARALDLRQGERVIDVGAGTGGLSLRLIGSGATVICLEPDAASLAAARRRLNGCDAEFLQARAEAIPLGDCCVDAAVASVTAHHWADPDAGFTELVRVLRPGARLAIAEFKAAGPLLRQLRRLAGSKHIDAPAMGEWTTRLRTAGFSDVQEMRAGLAGHLALFVRAIR